MSSKLEEPQRRLLLGKTCGARIRAVMAAGNRLTIRQRCLCENKPIDMVRKWVYTIPNTRKVGHRQMKHPADARHRLPGRMRCSQTNSRQTD